jgi:hypothetical protein
MMSCVRSDSSRNSSIWLPEIVVRACPSSNSVSHSKLQHIRRETVCQQLEDRAGHERSTLHVTRRYATANWRPGEFLRSTGIASAISSFCPEFFLLIAVPKIEIQNGLAGDIPTSPVCWLEQPKACGINSGLREVIDQRSPARERFRLHDPTLIVN